MNQYKLVACDLDGTLLDDNQKVSPQNNLAIEALAKKGVCFVPVTGRTLSEMAHVTQNPYIRYIIYSNGAAVSDTKTNEHTYLCMSRELSNFVLDTISPYDTYIIVHHGGQTHVTPMTDAEIKSYNVCDPVLKLIKNYANQREGLRDLAYDMDNVESIVIFFKNDVDAEICKDIIRKEKGLVFACAWEHSFEVFSANAGKDRALKLLANKLGIDIKDVIAVGDGDNDIPMARIAGLSLSPSNGCDEIKKNAQNIICSNNEHVVQYILSEYFTESETRQ